MSPPAPPEGGGQGAWGHLDQQEEGRPGAGLKPSMRETMKSRRPRPRQVNPAGAARGGADQRAAEGGAAARGADRGSASPRGRLPLALGVF